MAAPLKLASSSTPACRSLLSGDSVQMGWSITSLPRGIRVCRRKSLGPSPHSFVLSPAILGTRWALSRQAGKERWSNVLAMICSRTCRSP